jgi:hypothetical protein
MTRAQVKCFGCNRNFTPRGFSQHFSKSPDSRCLDARRAASRQVELVSGAFARTASPLVLDPDHASTGSGRVSPDDLGMHDNDLGGRDDDSEIDGHDDTHTPGSGSGRVSPDAPDDFDTHDYSLGGHHDDSEMNSGQHDSALSKIPGPGRVSPDGLGTHDYSLGGHDNDLETDGHGGSSVACVAV